MSARTLCVTGAAALLLAACGGPSEPLISGPASGVEQPDVVGEGNAVADPSPDQMACFEQLLDAADDPVLDVLVGTTAQKNEFEANMTDAEAIKIARFLGSLATECGDDAA